MKTLVVSILLTTTALAVASLPANARSGEYSSQEEHREHHRWETINK